MSNSIPAVGVMFHRDFAPESLPQISQVVEAAGLDDLWVVEDAFFNGGVSAAAVALASTQRITVGIGILPAVVRNAAYTAMDLATLARIFPGRLQIGLGHGVADWIRQVGEMPASQLKALAEVTAAIRSLLHGQTVTMHGSHVDLEAVKLIHPPVVAPPVSLGVTGPKSLALSGRVADGTILVELTGPALVRHNLDVIGGADDHQITVFSFWSQDSDRSTARSSLREMVAERIAREGMRDIVAPGFADEAQVMLDRGGVALLGQEMPDTWLDELTVSGTPDDCRAAIARLGQAGAHRVTLVPPADASVAKISQWLADLNPR